jgi:hypothetical protein
LEASELPWDYRYSEKTMKALDQFLPRYDFNEIHSVKVNASPEKTLAAVKALTPSELSPLIGILLGLRNLPSRLTGRAVETPTGTRPFLNQLLEKDFILLADGADEVVFGLVGQFWKLIGERKAGVTTPNKFINFNQTDFAKVVTNLQVQAVDGYTLLSTETRIGAPDDRTKRKFAFYWRLISIGSGWLRILWLSAIKRRAENRYL